MKSRKSIQKEPFRLAGDWGRQSNLLLRQFPELTDDDLEFEEGKEDELIKKIESRLQMDQSEVIVHLRKGQLATQC